MVADEEWDIEKVKDDIGRILRSNIKNLPKKQQNFVLTHIRGICLGTMSRESGLLAIRGKYGIRAEVTAQKILTDALAPYPNAVQPGIPDVKKT